MNAMPDSTPFPARSDMLYERVKAVIPAIEWPVFAGDIDAILELKRQRLAQDRKALRDRGATRQNAVEIRIRPNCWEQYADVGEAVAIHDPGQQAER